MFRILSIPSLVRNSQVLCRPISTLGVIGAGQMGSGIAQVAAQKAQTKVLIVDSDPKKLSGSVSFIEKVLAKDVSKGKITEAEKNETLSRITPASGLQELSSCDFVIEAATENLEVKKVIFQQLVDVFKNSHSKHHILATNTSSISITKIAAVTPYPERVIGMHFMNPVPVMKLVEIIPGLLTSPETLKTTLDFAHRMDKTTTESKDVPGFIANRLLMPYINEAIFALESGIGSKEDIDTTMKLGTNMPMGPLTLADFIGLDTCLAIMRVLHNELGDSKYRPCPLLIKYVDAGLLGKKVGAGFYHYQK